MKPSYVLFDYGEVLSLPQDPTLIYRMRELCQCTPETFKENYWRHRADYDRGDFLGHEFWRRSFPEKTWKDEELEQIIDLDCRSWGRINPEMIKWVEELKRQDFGVGILSNMPIELTRYLKDRVIPAKLFHHEFYSSSMRIVKPEPLLYERVLHELGLSGHSVIFWDDKKENIDAASRLQIKARKFTNVQLAREELSRV